MVITCNYETLYDYFARQVKKESKPESVKVVLSFASNTEKQRLGHMRANISEDS